LADDVPASSSLNAHEHLVQCLVAIEASVNTSANMELRSYGALGVTWVADE